MTPGASPGIQARWLVHPAHQPAHRLQQQEQHERRAKRRDRLVIDLVHRLIGESLLADRLQQILGGQPGRIVPNLEPIVVRIRCDRLDPGKP